MKRTKLKAYKNSDCYRCIDKYLGCGKVALQSKFHPIKQIEVLLCGSCIAIIRNESKIIKGVKK